MSAPSAGNEQPWYFVVIDDRDTLDEIPKFHPYSAMLQSATVAILICGDERLEVHRGFWVQDCSAATQNILLAAQAKGLGAVWLGVYPVEERVVGLRNLLGIPEDVIPFSLVSVGYPAERKPPADRYDKSRIHHNRWQSSTAY
jgi:nitroreductase